MELVPPRSDFTGMPDFAIDPELRIRLRGEKILHRTSDALKFHSRDNAEPSRPRMARGGGELSGNP
jgi:hypothetical protein